jgi:hypothetical protein
MRRLTCLMLALIACGKSDKPAPATTASSSSASAGFAAEDRPANLKLLVETIIKAHAAGDLARAAALTRALLPDEAAARKALRDDVDRELVTKVIERTPPGVPDEKLAGLLIAGQGRTEVRVFGATTEELRAYQPGSVAAMEFPSAMRGLAERALRPGVTFYEVACVEPGGDRGTKYHLFYWDGAGWRMLGAAWR